MESPLSWSLSFSKVLCLYGWHLRKELPMCKKILISFAYEYFIKIVQSLSHVWLCDPMDCSTPGFPVHLQLLEFAQNPCPLSWWCHPAISSSIVPFSSHLQSFPTSGSFLMRQFLTWGGQSIGVSASASVLPVNIQDQFPLGWTGWISLQSKELSRVFSSPQFKSISSFALSFLYSPSHPYMTTEKTIALTRQTFVGKVMSLLFNMLSRLVITFLPRSKCLLISWLQSPSAVILEPPK